MIGKLRNMTAIYLIKGEIRQNYYFFANLKENINDELYSN